MANVADPFPSVAGSGAFASAAPLSMENCTDDGMVTEMIDRPGSRACDTNTARLLPSLTAPR